MANKQRSTFDVTFESLQNRTFKIRYDNNGLAELEDTYGKAMPDIFEDISEGKIGYKFIRALVYSGLLVNNLKGITLVKVGKWLTDESAENSAEILQTCLKAFMSAHGIDPDVLEADEDTDTGGVEAADSVPLSQGESESA